MTRPQLAVFLAALLVSSLAVGCSEQQDAGSGTLASEAPTLRYKYWFGGGGTAEGSSVIYSSPRAAYQAGMAGLVAACSGNQDCIDDGELAIYPKIPGGSWSPELRAHGYRAFTALLKTEIQRTHSFFSDPANNARAVDYASSMENIRAVASTWTSSAQQELEQVQELKDRVGIAHDELIAQGEAIHGAEHSALVKKRIRIDAAMAVVDRYRNQIGQFSSDYAELADDYRSYHASEGGVIDAMADVIERGNAASIADFGPLQRELVGLAQSELSATGDLLVSAKRIRRGLEFSQGEFDARIEPHNDFLAGESVTVPDLTETTLDYLEQMIRYIDARVQRINHKVAGVLGRLQARRAALVQLSADSATRDAIRTTATASAATAFLVQANEQIKELWAAGPSAGGVELLAPRHQRIVAILQMERLCAADRRIDWMADGCGALSRNIRKARSYLRYSLRFKLRVAASKFRSGGADSALISEMQSAYADGDVERALFVHDHIAQDLEALR